MAKFQCYGCHADGRLCFAGVHTAHKPGRCTARRIVREWVEWARRYVAENPGEYPLAQTVRELPVRPVTMIEIWPIGRPELTETFTI